MSERIEQIDAYLDGELDRAESLELRAWINADPANARLFADRALLQYEVRSILKRDRMQTVQSPRQVLQELLELEQNAQAQLVHLHTLPAQRFAGARQFGMLLANPYTISGIAALFILTASLLLIFQSGGEEPANEGPATIAEQPERPIESLQTVATLTATHNAVWAPAGGASAPPANPSVGSKLHPNQRLTLTAGFAEITTHDGAVAILEAPATIELINTNALRLHTGKLVGVCETESSKGFVVRTQHMGVTDLGTRFGVEVTHEGTRAHVFEGDIAVHASDALDFDQATRLGVGESAITEAGKSIVITTNRPGLTFVRDWAAATNAPRVTGPIRYTASVPTALDFDQREADDHILLLSEHNGLRLSKDIPVSKAELLDGHRFRADSKVPAGTVVDTYLLHGDIVGDDPDKGINFRGSIRFDRPILGVIANGIDLSQSHRVLGLKGVFYPGMQVTQIVAENAGLEKSLKDKMFDGFQISEDRRTLSVGFDCGGSMDQMRVLILADEATPTN